MSRRRAPARRVSHFESDDMTYPLRPELDGPFPNYSSVMCRLLSEISWEGNPQRYRHGGRGMENVLSAEVFQALDFLPRTAFLGTIIRSATGARATLDAVAAEAENLRFRFLPGSYNPGFGGTHERKPLWVQPDGVLVSDRVFCLVEAKRIRSSSFQPEQLAREYVTTMREAAGKTPLMLLVLSRRPPVHVSRHGRLEVHDAIARFLPQVLSRVDGESPSASQLLESINSVVAFVTWEQIADILRQTCATFESVDPSVTKSVVRLTGAALNAIAGHA